MVSLAYRFTGNRDDALDVMQDTFVYLLGKFPDFELTASLKTFLYPAVKHLSLQRRRKAGREVPDDGALATVPAPTDSGTGRDDLAHVVRSLPPEQAEVLLLRFVDDLSYQEIAEALSVPLGTVKSRLHKAVAALRHDAATKKYFDQ